VLEGVRGGPVGYSVYPMYGDCEGLAARALSVEHSKRVR